MRSIIAKTLFAALTAAGVANCAVAAPAAPRWQDATWSGNGCGSGPTLTAESGGKVKMSFDMNAFRAQIGPGLSPLGKTVNCAVHGNVDEGIAGYRLAVTNVETDGFLYSGPGVTLTHFTTIFWSQDASNTYTARETNSNDRETGMLLQKVHKSSEVPVQFASPCIQKADDYVGILNINYRVSLTSSNAESFGAYLGMDGAPVSATVEFAWVKCSE